MLPLFQSQPHTFESGSHAGGVVHDGHEAECTLRDGEFHLQHTDAAETTSLMSRLIPRDDSILAVTNSSAPLMRLLGRQSCLASRFG